MEYELVMYHGTRHHCLSPCQRPRSLPIQKKGKIIKCNSYVFIEQVGGQNICCEK